MLCKCLRTLIFLYILILCGSSKALNIFELGLIGIGTSFVFNKYYDNSLNAETTYEKKVNLLEKYFEKSSQEISLNLDYRIPIQQQLLILEETKK